MLDHDLKTCTAIDWYFSSEGLMWNTITNVWNGRMFNNFISFFLWHLVEKQKR